MAVDIEDVLGDLGLDVLRPICVPQGVLCLIKVRTGGADANNHDGLAVSTEREFQQSCELRVSVRHVVALPLVAQGVDTASQGEQRLVDVGTFRQTLASVLRGTSTLTAGQIDDAERGHGVRLVDRGVAVFGGDVDLQDGV